MTMSCCGGKRAQLYRSRTSNPAITDRARVLPQAQARASASAPVIFEYLGVTGLTTMGAVTSKLYRFDARGARNAVDSRDAPALARVPDLRRLT